MDFQIFLAEKMAASRLSYKKLSELTNISVAHLEYLSAGNFDHLPPAPYVRGYLTRIGAVLDFEGDEWWEKIKSHEAVKRSGIKDSLPMNRFARAIPTGYLWLIGFTAVALIFWGVRSFVSTGKPNLAVTAPDSTLVTSANDQATLQGTLQNGDHLSINGEDVPVGPQGAWLKTVLLQPGLNSFEIDAKKLLGREIKILRQIVYDAPVTSSTPASSTLP